MKEKMKKILCIVLSSFLLLPNTTIFAQEVEVEKIVWDSYSSYLKENAAQIKNKLSNLREMFAQLKYSEHMIYSPKANVLHRINPILRELNGLEDFYKVFIIEAVNIDTHVSLEAQKTMLERLAYKYTDGLRSMPGVGTYGPVYLLEEEAAFTKIREGIKELSELAKREGVIDRDIIKACDQKVEMLDNALKYLDKNIEIEERILDKSLTRSDNIYLETIEWIKKAGITNEDIMRQAIKTIPEEDLKLIGLALEIKAGKRVNPFRIAIAMKNQLRKIGVKNQPSFFTLLKRATIDSYYRKLYKTHPENILNRPSQYKKLIEDFPIVQNGRVVNPKYTMRKLLRTSPLLIIGVALTAGAIMEMRTDNRFDVNSRGVRKIGELRNKVKEGSASFMETMMYYTDARTESDFEEDNPHQTANLIKMALAVNTAEKDFDNIAKDIQDEVGNEYAEVSQEEIQNNFDMLYDRNIQQIWENMI